MIRSKVSSIRLNIGLISMKHGASWQDENGIEVQAKSTTEPRYLRVAMLNNKLWSAFFTIRDNNIRIISVRRAQDNEEDLYYGANG